MRKKTPQDYADELMRMYRENNAELMKDVSPSDIVRELAPEIAQPSSAPEHIFTDSTGGLSVNVTTLSRLYPVKGAVVTVFTGEIASPQVIDTALTDQSGQSKVFHLATPKKSESQQAENGGEIPYANYNVSVKSDGYVEQIAVNVPVFPGVVSVQGIDLLPVSAAGTHTNPQIIEGGNDYNL